MTKQIYIISGLGADERVFQNLEFPEHEIIFIKWIVPLQEETMKDYATRLLEQIPTKKPAIIGLSFGGMIAIEIAKQIETEKIILIASAKSKYELPNYYRLAGNLGIHKLIPSRLLNNSNFISNWLFGAESNFDKEILKQILIETDPVFLKWAIDKIVHWSNKIAPINLFHIHGSHDRILPIRFVKPDLTIKNGGHLMTLNKSEELNKVLLQLL